MRKLFIRGTSISISVSRIKKQEHVKGTGFSSSHYAHTYMIKVYQ